MIVATMTSWKGRINNVLKVLKALMQQTIVLDKIYLNLSKEEFANAPLPIDLQNYIDANPTIILNWVDGPNTKPFKKIFPILKYLQDDDIILHVDDDSIPSKTFVASRLADFKKYNTCITGVHETFKGYAHGRLPELTHRFGPGTLTQKKMFNHWEEILDPEIIATNHDDAFYDFICWLNGYLPEQCTADLTDSFKHQAAETPALHGAIGCANADTATDINIAKFKEKFKENPRYNYFKTNKNPKHFKFVLFDRIRKAGDNAEYLYNWLKENRPEADICYILSSKSYDWQRLKEQNFNLIEAENKSKVQEVIDKADFVCFAYFAHNVLPGIKINNAIRVFLNHGVFFRITSYLKDKKDLFDLMLTSNTLEYETLLTKYGFPKDKIALTGLPRQDSLIINNQKYKGPTNNILIQFWWRPWIGNEESFISSPFYKNIYKFLTDNRLKELSEKYNVNFLLKLHCEMERYSKAFTDFTNVIKIPNSDLFEPLFIKSKAIITDFTSNVYEMGIIEKPCIYYRPDNEVFKEKNPGESYFDVKANGIGPCADTIDELFIALENLIKNNYILPDKYLALRKKQLIYMQDPHCCERAYNAILTTNREKKEIKPIANKKQYIGKKGYYLYF